jgi:hypothetical protein
MANIHVLEYSEVLGDVYGAGNFPYALAETYTRLVSAGVADDLVLQANTKMVRLWGESAFNYSFSGPATAGSTYWPAGVPVDLGLKTADVAAVGGVTLSLFAAA